ncbi:MAG: BON domain-containing protein [Pirellulales bacterium]
MTALLERNRNASPNPEAGDSSQSSADKLIALRVAHALAETHVPILRTLQVEVHDGAVTLRGRVRNYYERQLAHVRAKRVPNVRHVTEDISVATRPGDATGLQLWSSDVLPIDLARRSA